MESNSPTVHTIQTKEVKENCVGWICTCGASGISGRAYPGENVEKKAMKNFGAHVRRTKKKASI